MANEEENKSRFVSEDDTFVYPVCNNCRHDNGDGTCRAFPNGIPTKILIGKNNHSVPLPEQQNDITFEDERDVAEIEQSENQ